MTWRLLYCIVYRAFDKDSDGYLSREEWIHGMSILLKGTLDEKIECTYVHMHVAQLCGCNTLD